MKNSPYIKPIVDFIVGAALKLSGLKAYAAAFVLKILAQYGMKYGEKAIDKIQDNKTLKEFEEAKKTPSQKRDELEEDILTGK